MQLYQEHLLKKTFMHRSKIKVKMLQNRILVFVLLVILGIDNLVEASYLKPSLTTNPNKCEKITLPECQGVEYTHTSMPNLLKHTTQTEAAKAIMDFQPLFSLNCSAELRLFLCSVHVPICIESYSGPVPVCRPVCQRVKRGCLPIMATGGFQWPDSLDCDQFPESKSGVCMDPPPKKEKPQSNLFPNARGNTFSRSQDSKIGPKIPNQHHKGHSLAPKSGLKCKGVPLRRGSALYGANISYRGVDNCGPPCKSYKDPASESLLSTWLEVLTSVCLLVSVVSVVVHIVARKFNEYPQRAGLFISGCYFACSIAFLLRLIPGHATTSCLRPDASTPAISLRQSYANFASSSSACFTSFFLLHSGVSAAASWFLVAGLTWFLSATKYFAPEAINKYSLWFHASVWLTTLTETSLALITSNVVGDPTSGFCFLEGNGLIGFFIAPMAAKITIATIFMGIGMKSTSKILNKLPASQTTILSQLRFHLTLFSASFFIPTVSVITMSILRTSQEDNSESIGITNLYYSLLLMPGVFCGLLMTWPVLRKLLSAGFETMSKHLFYSNKKEHTAVQQRVLPPIPDLLNQQVHSQQVSAGVSNDNLHLANPNVGQCFVPRTLDSVNTAQTHLSESDSAKFTMTIGRSNL